MLFEKNRGVWMRKLDMTQTLQIYQVRLSLEESAGVLRAQQPTPEGAEHL
ncbi:hypothetical protein [Sodalis-like endosymbiont of Proechinophthirus fluctus]|nr:hypothetical protein [Sodalis-like endosymbiont of Proechinophthirus fluctus]